MEDKIVVKRLIEGEGFIKKAQDYGFSKTLVWNLKTYVFVEVFYFNAQEGQKTVDSESQFEAITETQSHAENLDSCSKYISRPEE